MADMEVPVEVGASDLSKAGLLNVEESRFIMHAAGNVHRVDSLMLQISDFPMQRAARPPEKTATPPKSREDDSILTFNFLYYIIQKYKLQDIID